MAHVVLSQHQQPHRAESYATEPPESFEAGEFRLLRGDDSGIPAQEQQQPERPLLKSVLSNAHPRQQQTGGESGHAVRQQQTGATARHELVRVREADDRGQAAVSRDRRERGDDRAPQLRGRVIGGGDGLAATTHVERPRRFKLPLLLLDQFAEGRV